MKIIYCGPITPEGKPSTGGYEAANRKNIIALKKQGVEVIELPYPTISKKWGPLAKLAYLRLYLYPLRMLRFRRKSDVSVHITPVGGPLFWPASFIVNMARRAGMKIIVDVRAGTFIHFYNTRGRQYRRIVRGMLNDADIITVEGSNYINFIQQTLGIKHPVKYFPNTATHPDRAPSECAERTDDTINLFYFGRVTATKGVDTMLEIIRKLDSRFRLHIAGPLAPDITRKQLDLPKVNYLGVLTAQQLQAEMRKMHIFLFPTRHIGEGQSNALIEAMSQGLIPVTSTQGFCREVVGNCGISLPVSASADEYCRSILKIAGGDLKAMARACMEHIETAHNTDIEVAKLKNLHHHLQKQKSGGL